MSEMMDTGVSESSDSNESMDGELDSGESTELTELTPEQYNKYRVKFKVSGEERAETLDEIIKKASLAEGARSKFDQAVTERKKAEAFYKQAQEQQTQYEQLVDLLRQAQSNPKVFAEFVKELGAENLNDFITDYITERAREEQLTPEQRKIKEYEQRLARHESEQQKIREQQEQENLQNRGTLIYNSISNEFADAIQSVEKIPLQELSELPDSSPKKQSIYLAMERALVLAERQLLEHGQFEPLENLYAKGLKQIRALSAAGREDALQNLAKGNNPIPKDLAKALSKQQIESLRKSQIGRRAAISNKQETPSKSSKVSKKTLTINEFFDF